jgi:hypothetical protein
MIRLDKTSANSHARIGTCDLRAPTKKQAERNHAQPVLALQKPDFSAVAAYLRRLIDFLTVFLALWDFFAPLRDLVDLDTLLRAVFLPLPAELFRVVAIFDNLL